MSDIETNARPLATSSRRDPQKKFVELANKRVTRAIKDLRLVANLANKNTYHYDEADARKIMRALQKEMDALKARFKGDDDGREDVFRL